MLKYKANLFEDAIILWKQALVKYQELNKPRTEGATWGNLGFTYFDLGKYQEAIVCHKQQLAIAQNIDNYELETNALNGLGNSYYSLGEFQLAIENYKQELAIAQQHSDRHREGRALNNLGNVFESLGEYQQAIESYQQSLLIRRELNDLEGEASALGNLGVVYYSLGKYQQSIDYHQQSLVIKQKIGDRLGEANSLGNLSLVFDALGKFPEAIAYSQECQKIMVEVNNRVGESQSLANLGNIFYTLGHYQKAIGYFTQFLEIARQIGDRYGEAAFLGNLGNAFDSLSEYEEAVKYYQMSLQLHKKIGNRSGEADVLGNLGNTYRALGEYNKAIEYYEQALTIRQLLGNHHKEANTLGGLGIVFYFMGQYELAIEYFQQQLNIAREIGEADGEGTALNNIGAALLKSNTLLETSQLLEVQSILRSAVEVWDNFRSDMEDADKISVFEEHTRTYRLLQEVLINQNKNEAALEIAERGRTRAFVDLLFKQLQLSSKQGTKASTALSHYIQTEQIIQNSTSKNLTIVEYSITYDEFTVQGRKETKESNLLMWVIKPEGKISFHKISLVSLHKINVSLAELIIEARRSIGVEDAENRMAESAIFQPLPARLKIFEKLQQLYQLLIQPIADQLPKDIRDIVVFIPQERLFLTPFPALQDSEGKFLIEKHTVLTAPSIQVLELIQKRSIEARETPLEALVVGNPWMPTIPLTEPPLQLQELPWSGTEAKAIAPLLQTQVITGAAATKVKIVEQMPKVRLIHLATHGLLDDIRQLGVPGAIALAPSDEDNGFLTAGEIYNMKLNAELVVLSACSTGQGKITGDGVIGLSRCLIAAGVKSLIVSLWSVGDLSTAFLMVKFYQIFQQGVAASIALNEAQRWLLEVTKMELEDWIEANRSLLSPTLRMGLRRRLHQLDDNSKPFQHPRHWAAFSAIGQ